MKTIVLNKVVVKIDKDIVYSDNGMKMFAKLVGMKSNLVRIPLFIPAYCES